MKKLLAPFFLISITFFSISDLKGVETDFEYQKYSPGKKKTRKESSWTVVPPSEEVREHSRLGITYLQEKKYKEALDHLKRAAELQNAGSRYNLGVLYEYGLGVELSLEEAAKWYSACGLDFPNASESLDRVIRKKQNILEQKNSLWSLIAG